MPREIKTIRQGGMPGGVNCYLVGTDAGYVLIDAGVSSKRADLERALADAGCRPGNLKLVILTHGDSDHAGSAAYLRERYGAEVAMHRAESAAVETGDMLASRVPKPFPSGLFTGLVLGLFRLGKADRFRPDLFVEDGFDLSGYGLGKVLHLPGHSKGSIGVLTAEGDLFCGDLLTNVRGPAPSNLIDDRTELAASLERLRSLPVKTVYPGHGEPFSMEALAMGKP